VLVNNFSNYEDAPWVHSISYGALESEIGYKYSEASNVELMKLGLRGITVVISSGDTGVYDEDGSSCGPFNPTFPVRVKFCSSLANN
jgi:tripeptidyl-peptidase-1